MKRRTRSQLLTLIGPPGPSVADELRRANREGVWVGLALGLLLGALAAWHALELARLAP